MSSSRTVTVRKGLDIPLKGEADKVHSTVQPSGTFAIKPADFHGIRPKLVVKQGQEVKAGTVLFYDKDKEAVKFTSPVSGEVAVIVRGEKRKLLEICILADKETKYEEFPIGNLQNLSRQQVIKILLASGAWPFLRQRPFDVVADPAGSPKAIFLSAFNSAPLGPDNDFIVHGHGATFQAGLDVLTRLTDGKVHLNVRPGQGPSKVFLNAKNVQINRIKGLHPAGNVGIQIHHIDPLNKGETIWYCTPQDVMTIGKLFTTGRFDASRTVALTGPGVKKAQYYKTTIGASIKNIVNNNVVGRNLRYISGNVLTGMQIPADGYLGFYDDQITVLEEGDNYEFMGWLAPGFGKFSLSRTFPSWLMPGKKYNLDTNLHGEERAFVVTGQYERVFPMDIFPVHLVKAILVGDIELMENLGIYEVAPEDFALCEYVCTSKIGVQQIVREGLDLVMEECT